MNKLTHGLAPALVLCLPLGVLAQSASSQAEDSDAPAPPLRYQSAFSDYKPWQDIKPGNWRQLNDALAATPAGHGTGHAGSAMPSTSTTAAPPPTSPSAAPQGSHSQHGGKP